MLKKRLLASTLALCSIMALPIYGQKSTEIFIPIGKSPGLSGKYSVIGKIVSIGITTRILTISGKDGEHTARITEKTKIWLDRSEAMTGNEGGSVADCRRGRLCEVKYVYEDKTRTDEAEWIKIRVSQYD